MATPSQDLIRCKQCDRESPPHKSMRLFCEACAKRKQVEKQRAYRERLKQTPRVATCSKCESEFDASLQGRTWLCPVCNAQYMRDYALANRDRSAEHSRKYRATLADVYRERMVKRRRDAIASMSPQELVNFRKKESDKTTRLTAKLREEVFTAYGGAQCACCGEQEPKFLTIDHVENNGAEMRRNGTHSRGGTAFYQWLRKSGFPEGFQVLCMNCNMGKHRNGGVCPHKSGKV